MFRKGIECLKKLTCHVIQNYNDRNRINKKDIEMHKQLNKFEEAHQEKQTNTKLFANIW